jgi:hypothetical protein
MALLLGIVLRAGAVALLTATLLLPIADHHAGGRLPETALMLGEAGPDLHEMLVHHHARPHHGHAATAADSLGHAVPTLVPGSPPPASEVAGAPSVTAAPGLTLPPLVAAWLPRDVGPVPTQLAQPPLERPPNRVA